MNTKHIDFKHGLLNKMFIFNSSHKIIDNIYHVYGGLNNKIIF